MTEASEIWHSSDSDVKSLKKELAREKREKRKLQATSDQQITELTETIEILGKQQSDHKAKYQELCAAQENAKIFKKDLKNQFKVYDCKYHSCTTESTANENFLNFKNQFFK